MPTDIKPATSFDLTLILPPLWDVTRPWTATAYLTETMKAHGYRVQFLDYNIRLFHQCERFGCGALWTDPGLAVAWRDARLGFLVNMLDLDEIGGGVIGVSVGCTGLAFSLELMKALRRKFPHRKIILGGHELFLPQDVARVPLDCADAICKGEGELTLRDVMARGFSALEEVPGLYLPRDDGWRLTRDRELLRELDTLPWLTFDEVDVTEYTQRMLPLVGSRGCINQCTYCYDRFMTQSWYRTRSAPNLVDELAYLSERYDVEHFPYNDSLLNGHVGILEGRADGILERGLQIQYGGNLMVRDSMDQALFNKLRKSGLTVGLIGVESGSASVLAAMHKRHTPESAAEFVRQCHNAGIRTELNFLLGFPGETEENFQESLTFLKQNKDSIDVVISVAVCQLYPSELLENKDDYGLVTYADNPSNSWHTRDRSNTIEIRMERFHRFMKLANELGKISSGTTNADGAPAEDLTTLTDRLVKAYQDYWTRLANVDHDRRSRALAAIKPWLQTMTNRRIARVLDRVGLLNAAKAVKSALKR